MKILKRLEICVLSINLEDEFRLFNTGPIYHSEQVKCCHIL